MIGFFSGYQIAFLTANRLGIELKKKQQKSSGIILSAFLERPSRFLGTCLVGAIISMVTYGLLFDELLKKSFWIPISLHNYYLILIVDCLIGILIALFFGKFFPQVIFWIKRNTLLSALSPVAQFFNTILEPITDFFIYLTNWILKYLFNIQLKEKDEMFSSIDMENFIQQSNHQEEENPLLNKELFENALSLPNIKVRQCLVPRTEIESVEIESNIDQAREKFENTKLSKLIVYKKNIDEIQGYIHQLDLFKKPTSIKEIMLPIPAIPESMTVTELIGKFTKERKSIAWVVDEFGGTSGIVTMEDLLEEIFGEIQDEFDTEDFVEKQLSLYEFLFSGRLELDYLREKYHLEFPDTDAETLSGYIINKYEAIPKKGNKIFINHYQFDIQDVSDRRIEMIKMKILK